MLRSYGKHIISQNVKNLGEFPTPTAISDKKTISSFYDNTSVLITGATGFLGKTLLEKLLRTCTGIRGIYVLIRPLKGLNEEERLKQLFNNSIFDKLKDTNPSALSKVKLISGDLTDSNLKMPENVQNNLIDNVNIIFHCAANVSFHQPLKLATKVNTLGTLSLLDLSTKIKNLKCFVYVSSVFAHRENVDHVIKEEVYKTPYDPRAFIKVIENVPSNKADSVLIGNHPNTYTFSKDLAEALVNDYSSKFSTVIVRPSIVACAWKEPIPGWNDNLFAFGGYIHKIGNGTMRCIITDKDTGASIVPVDIVSNTVITAAWRTSKQINKNTLVYNCTNSNMNPVKWTHLVGQVEQFCRLYPTLKTLWYPKISPTTNKFIYWYKQVFLQYLVAMAWEIESFLTNGINYRLGKYIANLKTTLFMIKVTQYFTKHDFKVEQKNMKKLIKDVQNAEDYNDFNIDITNKEFSWNQFVKDYVLGQRKYVFEEDLTTLPQAKKKLNKLFFLRLFFMYGTPTFIAILIGKENWIIVSSSIQEILF